MKLDLKSLSEFDWRSLNKYFSPHAANDFNKFLEAMPQTIGQKMLIIAGVVWGFAALVGLYTTVQINQLTELRATLQEADAIKPSVPKVSETPIDSSKITEFVEQIKPVYRGLDITSSGSSISITAQSTNQFGQFREAVGHVQNGGSGWRVNVEELCVGRECDRIPLAARLKINKVSVDSSL